MSKIIVKIKSFEFALKVVDLSTFLVKRKEFVLSRQLTKSGTAIGALIRESEHAESKADFVHKLSIALKEANETDYWIEIIFHTKHLSESSYLSMKADIQEILRILTSIIKTTKQKMTTLKK